MIINYVKRDAVRGTFLDSHFSWQIRTFWWSVLWVIIAAVLIATLIGMVIGIPIMLLLGLWVVDRIARGWITLTRRKPMPV